MSKLIKMTEKYMEEVRADFEKAISLAKLTDGKLNFTKVFSAGDRKAVIHFTSIAWKKMTALIREFDKEVAWHGVAYRAEDSTKDEYIISDIVVYPQEVSGASVEMDTEEYAQWLMANADDARFERLYMQGHSHVDMGTKPSSVDLNHQEEILGMLGDHDFYIFMIWNKSLSSNTKIYDMEKNILFENADVTVTHDEDETEEFIRDARKMVVSKTITYQASTYTRPEPLQSSALSIREKPRTHIGAGWSGVSAYSQHYVPDDDIWPYPYH